MADITKNPILSVCATVGSRLVDLPIKDGQLIFVRDRHRIALDFKGERKFYNHIEEIDTEDDRTSIESPVEGSYYFVIDTSVLWTYHKKWIQITTPPREIIFFGTEMPELGANKTLYVDTAKKNISVWDDTKSEYVVVADRTMEMTAEDVINLFKTT